MSTDNTNPANSNQNNNTPSTAELEALRQRFSSALSACVAAETDYAQIETVVQNYETKSLQSAREILAMQLANPADPAIAAKQNDLEFAAVNGRDQAYNLLVDVLKEMVAQAIAETAQTKLQGQVPADEQSRNEDQLRDVQEKGRMQAMTVPMLFIQSDILLKASNAIYRDNNSNNGTAAFAKTTDQQVTDLLAVLSDTNTAAQAASTGCQKAQQLVNDLYKPFTTFLQAAAEGTDVDAASADFSKAINAADLSLLDGLVEKIAEATVQGVSAELRLDNLQDKLTDQNLLNELRDRLRTSQSQIEGALDDASFSVSMLYMMKATQQ